MVVEHIEKAWKAYRKNFWQIIGATILYFTIVIGVFIISFIPLLFSGLLTVSEFMTSAQFRFNTNLVTSIFIFFVGLITAMILSIVLYGGLVGVYADALKGKAEFQKMFEVARKKFFTIFGANALAGIILAGIFLIAFAISAAFSLVSYTIFFVFFILGLIIAFLLSLLFSLVNQAIIVDNKKAIDSVKKSIDVVKSNYLQFLALTIIFGVIWIIISFVPLLGFIVNLLVVVPVSGIAYTAFYLAKRKKR